MSVRAPKSHGASIATHGTGPQAGSSQTATERLLTPKIRTLAAVVVLGAIMTVLDATIVNVALPTLGREFGTSIATIQWVTRAYLLAFASVIPLTGWASQRLGAKELWSLPGEPFEALAEMIGGR